MAMIMDNLPVAADASFQRAYVLPKAISAIQIIPSDESGSIGLGLLVQLPEGVEVEVNGAGFNDSTWCVRCGHALYYVFREELEATRKHMAASA